MFSVKVCFYIFLILYLTSSWMCAKHVWEKNFFRKSAFMAIRNARLAEKWHQVTVKGMQFDSGSFFLQ